MRTFPSAAVPALRRACRDGSLELLNDLASDSMSEFVTRLASLPDEPTPQNEREVEARRGAIPAKCLEGEVSGNAVQRRLAKRGRIG